jgi:hypothetical protein
MQLRVMNIPGIGMNVESSGISPLATARVHRSEDIVAAQQQQQLVIDATIAKSSSTGGAAAVAGAPNTNGNANCVSTYL